MEVSEPRPHRFYLDQLIFQSQQTTMKWIVSNLNDSEIGGVCKQSAAKERKGKVVESTVEVTALKNQTCERNSVAVFFLFGKERQNHTPFLSSSPSTCD